MQNIMDECICNNPESWGYTCPVHKIVSRAEHPRKDLTSLSAHADKYHPNAWAEYTDDELRQWVHLLKKRATMRSDDFKRRKDLEDAANYQAMLDSRHAAESAKETTMNAPHVVLAVYKQDEGGNSTITRLESELNCNSAKPDDSPVTDSSLTYGDLRKIRDAFLAQPPAAGGGKMSNDVGYICGLMCGMDKLLVGGCGEHVPAHESYRCTHCTAAFHRECANKHFELSGEKRDRPRTEGILKRIEDIVYKVLRETKIGEKESK